MRMKSMYWLVQKDGDPDKSYCTNDVEELNTILGIELSEKSYKSMEPGYPYWVMKHKVIYCDGITSMYN